jgi:hypothetical protein
MSEEQQDISKMNLLAMIRNLGNPHLFVTLSPDEFNCPELYSMLTGLSLEEVKMEMQKDDKFREKAAKVIRGDPVLVVQFLERKVHGLIQHVINGPLLPLGSKVKDFFIRREFQKRGSVHYHMLLWMEEFPNIKKADEMVSYIDKVISTEWPDNTEDPELFALVETYQVHRHYRGYCQKNSKKQCRFKFPFDPCAGTHFVPHGVHHVDLLDS